MECPRCHATEFVETIYENLPVDVCQSCHGVWLDEGEISGIVSTHHKHLSQDIIKEVVRNSFSGIPESEKDEILSCPKCSQKMAPLNYEVSSGVIIDRCPKGHGLWLDKHELEKVQAYREYWSEQVDKHREDFINLLHTVEKNKKVPQKTRHSFLFTLAEIFSRFS